jgi:hypothetical protein
MLEKFLVFIEAKVVPLVLLGITTLIAIGSNASSSLSLRYLPTDQLDQLQISSISSAQDISEFKQYLLTKYNLNSISDNEILPYLNSNELHEYQDQAKHSNYSSPGPNCAC